MLVSTRVLDGRVAVLAPASPLLGRLPLPSTPPRPARDGLTCFAFLQAGRNRR